jgi:pyruvate dehydrogenase E1 component alpha subunit
MSLLRRFDERAGELYGAGQIGGFLHLAIGEEATIVGAVRALEDRDWILTTYRPHAHAIVRGTEPSRVMAELFGKTGGPSGGRGGGMHLCDPERRLLGGYGIAGGHLSVAAGVALASKLQGRSEVTLCVLGDGATTSGSFSETLNLSALWDLPVVLLAVVDQDAGTVARRPGGANLQNAASGYGVKSLQCDGMDVVDTHAACTEAVRIARSERRPVVVEAFNRRPRGRSMADPEPFRGKAALAEWRKRDPIAVFGERLVEVGLMESSERARITMSAQATVEQAVSYAGRSAAPEPSTLYDNVYVLSDEAVGWHAFDQRGIATPGETLGLGGSER